LITCCPKCGFEFGKPLINGMVFCSACNQMVESNKINFYLSIFRHIKKNHTFNLNQIKHELKCKEHDVIFVSSFAIDNEYSFEEFEKALKSIFNI
jgi:adenine-specific DNA methylase